MQFGLKVLFSTLILLSANPSYSGIVTEPPFSLAPHKTIKLDQNFIFPNEWFDSVYELPLKGTQGALITTGTFRFLQKILYADFDWVFLVDVDPLVIEFNRLNIKAILESNSLKDYLKLYPKEGKIKNNILSNFLTEHDLEEEVLIQASDYPEDRASIKKFFFNDEQRFQLLKEKIKRTKIVLIEDSITCLDLATKLDDFLSKNRIPLNAIDVSNILDYISTQPGQLKAFGRVLNILPTKPDTKILFTTFFAARKIYRHLEIHPELEAHDDAFYYFLGSPQNLNDMIQEKKWSDKKPPLRLETKKVSCLNALSGQS